MNISIELVIGWILTIIMLFVSILLAVIRGKSTEVLSELKERIAATETKLAIVDVQLVKIDSKMDATLVEIKVMREPFANHIRRQVKRDEHKLEVQEDIKDREQKKE